MTNLAAQQPAWLAQHIEDDDLIRDLLADKRSPSTRRAYEKDLKYFFRFVTGSDPTPEVVGQFLGLSRVQAIKSVLRYKASLLESGLAEATVNRRLAAIKSLVSYAQKIDKCSYSLEEIKGEKVVPYRDTSGITAEEFQKMLNTLNRASPAGKRDYALLSLLWSNALRRNEVLVKVSAFDAGEATLTILGKGRGTQSEKVKLPSKTVKAIADWLKCRSGVRPSDPLFTSLDPVNYGKPLTGDGVYKIVRVIALKAGITKTFSPHRIRHSSITSALDATNGDVRTVQKFSRHKKSDTLLIYDDNRENAQERVSELVSNLI